MLIGSVSDEMFVAVPDVLVEFRCGDDVVVTRSLPSGAIHADIRPGEWDVILARAGYTSKIVRVQLDGSRRHRFRLLSDAFRGYAWPKWVRAGEQAELRVHSRRPYDLELWRYGQIKEQQAYCRRFESLAPDGDAQILPDEDFTIGGARWNDHGYDKPRSARQTVVAPERSGLYWFHARDIDGATTSFPWIVAPRVPATSVAVLASNITWNAYNDFGGRSNYVTAGRLPDVPAINTHQGSPWFRDTGGRWWVQDDYDPLSFDRPEPINVVDRDEDARDPIRRFGAEHVAPGEWRLLAWLEREGFEYDYYAETQLHSEVMDLDAYRVLIMSTHPEYWSKEMYHRVKAWVGDRGGRLMYLGGNGINAEVELTGAPDAMRVMNTDLSEWLPDRSLSGPGALVPDRFGRRVEPESRLLGVGSTLTGVMTAGPYRVMVPEHWAFDGLGLRAGDLFGHRNQLPWLQGGASGHETDKMDRDSPANAVLLAKGTNPDEGGAEIVFHTTHSGGAVFSVGSISWGASVLVDDQTSRVTSNVLRRFMDERVEE